MSNNSRALAIGLIGPTICALGLAWVLIGAALDPTPDSATLRHYVFDGAHLVLAVGIAVSFISLPVALAVAVASPEDVEIPVIDEAAEEAAVAQGERRLATE